MIRDDLNGLPTSNVREPLLIVTYSVTAREMIDGQPVSTEPAYRLSVFIPDGEAWQLLAHANLAAIQPRR
jgi:hypothetical protein